MIIDINKLFKINPISIYGRNNKVYSFSKDSKSFDFYTDQFKSKNTFEIGSGVKEEDLDKSPKEMIEVISFLKKRISENQLLLN